MSTCRRVAMSTVIPNTSAPSGARPAVGQAQPRAVRRAEPGLLRAAAAEVALELAGDRVAAGPGQVVLSGTLLQRADVLDDLGVLVGHLVDGLDPVVGLLRQRAHRHGELEDLLD